MATNPRAVIGDNGAPDPIDLALQPFADILSEVENWLDGETVADEAQLADTDKLLKELKAARKAVDTARDEYTKPLHEVWKSEVARWKPTQDDLDRQVKCLVSAQTSYKAKLAAEKEAKRLAAEQEAVQKAKEAREAAEQARSASIADARKADELLKEAEQAQKAASRAAKDTVKGMRTVQTYAIFDYKAALYWIAKNDKPSMTDFIEEYVRTHFKTGPIDGVTVSVTKEAF